MKEQQSWKPSKYVFSSKGCLMASRNPKEVAVSSRLMADAGARPYGRYLPVHARGRLLDLGCGKVPLYAVYKDHVSDIVCVDWANTAHKNPHLDMEWDLNRPLPFDAAAFDTVLLSDVLEHIREPEALIREIARVLRPSGKLIMNVPFFYWLHESPHDYFRYTQFALRSFAANSGLNVILLETIGGAPEILADILSKNLVFKKYVGKMLARCIQGATGWLVSTGRGSRFSAATASQFPLGYFMIAQKFGETPAAKIS